MKKNWTMRVALLIVALSLITSCFVSGTFAKYVTSGSSTDNARVAKFGVTVIGSSDLFATTYAKDDTTFTLSANSVESSNSDKLVAPGTTGSLSKFALTGTPEVAVRVTYDVTSFTIGNNWIDKLDTTKFYFPITITIVNPTTSPATTTTINGLDYADAASLEAAVIAAIEGTTKDYAANTDLSAAAVTADCFSISWAWAFEGATGSANNQSDEKDTFLGDRAAADIGNAGTISIAITAAVTQID